MWGGPWSMTSIKSGIDSEEDWENPGEFQNKRSCVYYKQCIKCPKFLVTNCRIHTEAIETTLIQKMLIVNPEVAPMPITMTPVEDSKCANTVHSSMWRIRCWKCKRRVRSKFGEQTIKTLLFIINQNKNNCDAKLPFMDINWEASCSSFFLWIHTL